ncbi:EamA family transporter, partial [Cohnella sp. GbtcB17]|uniref:EamA family transporter n=1 Tax=Cohnella sp. GbtcB17 TaxID=2824762 RepID=UPI001C3080A7
IGLYASGTAGFWIQALLTHTWQPYDWRVWTAGADIGLGSAWGNLLFMRAIGRGPASLVSPITNANIVIVLVAGLVWCGETPHTT